MITVQERKNWEMIVSKLIAKAWLDQDFYHQFVSEPAKILREAGLVIDNFVKVIVNQNPATVPALTIGEGEIPIYEINLPPKPARLIDEHITAWSADTPNLFFCLCDPVMCCS